MDPRKFESDLLRLIKNPVVRTLDSCDALHQLEATLDWIERRHRQDTLLRRLKSLASHFVLEGDEDDVL